MLINCTDMPKHPDLFKKEPTEIGEKPKGWVQERKRQLRYHEAQDDEPSCKDCDHLIKQRYRDYNYYKCELIGISRSEATDIRLKDTCKKHSHLNSKSRPANGS